MNALRKVCLLAVLILALGLSQPVIAQKGKRSSARTPRSSAPPRVFSVAAAPIAKPDVQRRIDTFEKVWRTIQENYFDPSFNNLNWTQVYQEFSPKVRAVKTDAELHKLLGEMIDRLQRSHLAIIPPEVYQAIEKARTDAKQREAERLARIEENTDDSGDEDIPSIDLDDPLTQYGPGVELRLIGNHFVITRMDNDSAAEYAGLKTGYTIEAINDVSMSMLLAKLQVYNVAAKNLRRYLPQEIVEHFLNGEKDSLVKIAYLDEKDERKEVNVRRERIRSETVSISPNYPETQLQFETSSLGEDVGLIRFNRFALRSVERFCDALTQFRNKKALVIDLRGNMGGNMNAVMALAGMLTDKKIDLGTSIYRSGPERMVALSKAKNFKGRIVVLVDNVSVSAAEMFASSLQEARRAVIVGEQTAGETLPALAVDLPTGARLMYPIANYRSAGGKLLEGNGVIPDQVVLLDRKSLLSGRDVQLEAGLTILKDESVFARLTAPNPAPVPGVEFSGPVPAPPPPAKKLPSLGTVTVFAPPSPTVIDKAPVRDPTAIRVIEAYASVAGTPEARAAVKTYTMRGELDLGIRGIWHTFDYRIFRELPDKHAEVNVSPSTGEIRRIYEGKIVHIKSDLGFDEKLPAPSATVLDLDFLLPVERVNKSLTGADLKYLGIFERDGMKVHTIEAKTKGGETIALAFDVKTGMLAGLADDMMTISYSDFRKVGDLIIPFRVENGGWMRARFEEIQLNGAIDAAVFRQKEHCFDKPSQ